MIDTCLSILDRLIKVVAIRGKRRNRLFSELWDSTFSELLIVHRDYIEMFEKIKSMLSKLEAKNLDEKSDEFSIKVDEIIEYLRLRRIEFEPVRRKLIALIDTISDSNLDDQSKTFVESLVAYFPIGADRIRYSTGSAETLTLLEVYREGIEDSGNVDEKKLLMSLSDIMRYVSNIISQQRNRWSIVCEAYAPLKIAQSKRWF